MALSVVVVALSLLRLSLQFECSFNDEQFLSKHFNGSDNLVRSLPHNIEDIKWRDGILKYEFDPNLSQEDRQFIFGAFREFESRTCIRHQARGPNDRAFTRIFRDDNNCAGHGGGCGMMGPQETSWGRRCQSTQVMVHEFMHAHCYPHEQHRPDRDWYVTYPRDKCPNGGPNKCEDCVIRESLYDYTSIVSDGCYQCSHVGWPTMPGVEKCGGDVSRTLSVMDVDKLNELYNCQGCYRHRWRAIENVDNIPERDRVTFAKLPNGGGLSICRGYANGEVVVGKYWHDARTCWISFGGEERGLTERFQIFTIPGGNLNQNGGSYRLVDRRQIGNARLVPGGRKANTETGYIAVAEFGAESSIGKKWENEGHATFPVDGRERGSDEYRLLTCG